MTASDTPSWYDAHAADLALHYEAIDPGELHAWFADLLPPAPALILDVGAGTGRDATWLAGRSYDVVAVEPSSGMRADAQRRHGDAGPRWIDDDLPSMSAAHRLGLAFDLILLNAVWQHVAPGDRERAFRKLLNLLRPGGALALSLRHGPAGAGGRMHPVSLAEIEQLARMQGAIVVLTPPKLLPANRRQSANKRLLADCRWFDASCQTDDSER